LATNPNCTALASTGCGRSPSGSLP
jgi:hypothetical protein